MPNTFIPADSKAEAQQRRGLDVSSPCRNCGLDFFEHTNGQCPADKLYSPALQDHEILTCGCGARHRSDEHCPNGCDD